MTVMQQTPECFPHRYPFSEGVHGPLGHNLCPAGFHQPGVIGGWDCSCPCHHNGGKPAEPRISTCDWGDCDEEAVDSRWSGDLRLWLSVCAGHVEPVRTEFVP